MTLDFGGYPRGWFPAAWSDEIPAGGVTPLRYVGRDLVAFRGDSGQVRILDAHCPHLGAHLGVGGKVVGDTVQCPFHAWRFASDGRCVDIPYASKIPPRACVRSWRVHEVNNLIFFWHDPEDGEPDYEIPDIAARAQDSWTPWTQSLMTIKTRPREIIENVADKAHFPRVHNTHLDSFENEFVGHMAVQRASGIARPQGGGKDHFKLTATYYGPSFQVTVMSGFLPCVLINCHTPIDETSLHLRFGVSLKITGNADNVALYADKYADNLRAGFAEDVQIWEHKLWRDRPILSDGDGAIGKLRKWYHQFYEPRGAAAG